MTRRFRMLADVVTPLGHYVTGLSYTAQTEALEQQATAWVAEGKAEWMTPGAAGSGLGAASGVVRGIGTVH